MRTLVVIPTYEEALEHHRGAHRACGPRSPTPTSSSSTTAAPTAPPTSPSSAAPELGQIDVLRARRRRTGSAPRTAPGSGWGIDRGYEVLVQMDADLSHDPAALPALLGARRRRRRPRDRLALRPRAARSRTGRGTAARCRSGGNRYACFVLGMPVHDATAGFRAYRARRCSTRSTSSRTRADGLRVPDRDRPTASPRGAAARRGADHVPRPRARPLEDVAARDGEELLLVTWWGIRDRTVALRAAAPPLAGRPGPGYRATSRIDRPTGRSRGRAPCARGR